MKKETPLSAHQREPIKSPAVRITFEVSPLVAMSLKSAIEDISNIVGHRLEGSSKFSREDALTRAAIGLGILRAAITQQVPKGDRDYV